ncbi:anaerobic ribonucleoside-triphosphate reductase activating protein [Solitalea canadensis]|uniref:Anaerobic ribonucleoside-triphosphate reductase activating protein n=1 Tax=Solitalea canadensis (strain ATCC 29591 / DSM 3403 / JCM 21819 / LMG 8368 / NBRC 15130 / NCIMB 12057 / USAM 9D) TaxID=929556 RepID=H8KUA6_SOLCM|nr:anaerobic ribonucleoside-triphosphate reductase activating protein [Solitalea canadensis]AFD07218.1 anaerobic ribonucleoside-triphosphate reductase activating protein [Solitalea canadensis DSM 3403]
MSTSNEHTLTKLKPQGPIYSITPFTLLDYPDKTACILWFAGCNMRCLYCYNPDVVLNKGSLSFEHVYRFLDSRKGLLDGVVLSGGECTMHKHIIPFIEKIKAMGFTVKIDTNGSRPMILHQLINDELIDYVALDFKALPDRFQYITQSNLFSKFEQTLSLLLTSTIKFEVRTTVHADLITTTDLIRMVSYLQTRGYKGNYYIQYFVNNVKTLSDLRFSPKELKRELLSTSQINLIFRE